MPEQTHGGNLVVGVQVLVLAGALKEEDHVFILISRSQVQHLEVNPPPPLLCERCTVSYVSLLG